MTLSASRLSARHFMDPALMRLSIVCGKMLAWVDGSPVDGSTRQITSSSLIAGGLCMLNHSKSCNAPICPTNFKHLEFKGGTGWINRVSEKCEVYSHRDQTIRVRRDGSLIMPHSLPDGTGIGAGWFGSSLPIPTEHTTNELRFPLEMVLDFFATNMAEPTSGW